MKLLTQWCKVWSFFILSKRNSYWGSNTLIHSGRLKLRWNNYKLSPTIKLIMWWWLLSNPTSMDPLADNKMITSSDNFVDVCRFNIGIFKILEKRPILYSFVDLWNFLEFFQSISLSWNSKVNVGLTFKLNYLIILELRTTITTQREWNMLPSKMILQFVMSEQPIELLFVKIELSNKTLLHCVNFE